MKLIEHCRYGYIWPDGAEAQFTVTKIEPKTIHIRFDNGAENRFSVGSPIHKNCYPIYLDTNRSVL